MRHSYQILYLAASSGPYQGRLNYSLMTLWSNMAPPGGAHKFHYGLYKKIDICPCNYP